MKIKLADMVNKSRESTVWLCAIRAMNLGLDIQGKDFVFDIKLIVNGVDVNFEEFADEWQEAVGLYINAEAMRLVNEKIGGFMEAAQKFRDEISSETERLFGEPEYD